MQARPPRKTQTKPFILTPRHEEILKTIHFYRYMTAMDVTRRLYSPASLTYVRSLLSSLAGGKDFATHQYLYRFQLPSTSAGGKEKIYTLGSRGRDFLARELGLPVDWYFRPQKLQHFSHSHLHHQLLLTRFLVAAQTWSDQQPAFKLTQTRLCYELAKTPATVTITHTGKTESLKVIPDAWLLFEQRQDGLLTHAFPLLLEIDRGTEYQQKFKQHIRARLEFIKQGGGYSQLFATGAVTIAYATTGQTPEYRDSRRRALCAWTREVLAELHKENWASVFRFHSLCREEIETASLFEAPVWYRPDSEKPVRLFAA